VPFVDPLIGLKKFPEGPDAADLARAIKYATYHRKCSAQEQGGNTCFPLISRQSSGKSDEQRRKIRKQTDRSCVDIANISNNHCVAELEAACSICSPKSCQISQTGLSRPRTCAHPKSC
jgi:hypothetical protein